VGLSRSHLSRSFKKAYGIGLADFVLAVRLERARRLLRETALTVVELSREAGFSSPSYFHQAFRRAMRTTPERYRAEAQHPNE
jgi:AraC family transcriptional regulator